MNGRERYVRAITFDGPDRVPVMHRVLPGAFRVHGDALRALLRKYPDDVLLSPRTLLPFEFTDPAEEGVSGGGRLVDHWGCVYLRTTSDYEGQVVEHPLADWKELSDYRWPDPMEGSEAVDELAELVREDKHQNYVLVEVGNVLFRIVNLHGFENTLIDLSRGSQELLHVLDRVVGYMLRQIERWLREDVDGVLVSDDWGTQLDLFMNPATWREVFKPAYRTLVEAIHYGGAYAHFHTDGNTTRIIPDLIEIGFDEINPQISCMDLKELSQEAGGKVCVRADLDRQHILPSGTVDDVRRHVQEAFEAFGRFNGGYVGFGQIGPDVPLANAEAMLKAFGELGHEI